MSRTKVSSAQRGLGDYRGLRSIAKLKWPFSYPSSRRRSWRRQERRRWLDARATPALAPERSAGRLARRAPGPNEVKCLTKEVEPPSVHEAAKFGQLWASSSTAQVGVVHFGANGCPVNSPDEIELPLRALENQCLGAMSRDRRREALYDLAWDFQSLALGTAPAQVWLIATFVVKWYGERLAPVSSGQGTVPARQPKVRAHRGRVAGLVRAERARKET